MRQAEKEIGLKASWVGHQEANMGEGDVRKRSFRLVSTELRFPLSVRPSVVAKIYAKGGPRLPTRSEIQSRIFTACSNQRR